MKARFLVVMLLFFLPSLAFCDAYDTVLKTHNLRVCIWPEYYSISYVNPRTQKLTGIDVELAHAFAASLDAKPEFIPSSFATLIKDVTSKKCDIAMFGIGHTAERKERLYLTAPHLESDIYAIASKGNSRIQTWEDIDKEGVIVAVAKGTYHVTLMQQNLKFAKLLIVDSMRAREQEVESGRADVFMTDYPFGMRFLNETDWAKLIKPSKPLNVVQYGWALAPDEGVLIQKAEAFMQSIKTNGTLQEVAKKYHLEPIMVR